ncbi:hypothetical protein K8F61_17115 [Microbacterium resistens]|uniref:Uncharacterized protein n=1 Tax=Microbacterium resistens TaxID=156977 RepID=A0ABY3RTU5_9MICO|nr:hypothetical protein [Microbacterium resistens]UGS26325.1 hypothetical protein K8F61_17115 [Microbacterium resistens]
MATKGLRVKIHSPAVVALMQSQEVADDLTARGTRIAEAAGGEGFEVRTTQNRDRAVVFVTTVTHEARKAEAEDRALTRAVGAGR